MAPSSAGLLTPPQRSANLLKIGHVNRLLSPLRNAALCSITPSVSAPRLALAAESWGNEAKRSDRRHGSAAPSLGVGRMPKRVITDKPVRINRKIVETAWPRRARHADRHSGRRLLRPRAAGTCGKPDVALQLPPARHRSYHGEALVGPVGLLRPLRRCWFRSRTPAAERIITSIRPGDRAR
jgi:hypothetical protein